MEWLDLSNQENVGGVKRLNDPHTLDSMGSKAWKTIIWKRMESLIDEFYSASVVVYSIERTLEKMRNSSTQTSLLETVCLVNFLF